jgi:hypothetical protein
LAGLNPAMMQAIKRRQTKAPSFGKPVPPKNGGLDLEDANEGPNSNPPTKAQIAEDRAEGPEPRPGTSGKAPGAVTSAGGMGIDMGALQRRLSGIAPGQGAPGPSGGKSKLVPSNKASAGSLFKKNPKAGKMTTRLHNLPIPGR